jgi:hypothetical protein
MPVPNERRSCAAERFTTSGEIKRRPGCSSTAAWFRLSRSYMDETYLDQFGHIPLFGYGAATEREVASSNRKQANESER